MGLPGTVFLGLVKRGVLPAGTPFTKKVKRWQALTIFCCGHLLNHLRTLAGDTWDGEEDDGEGE